MPIDGRDLTPTTLRWVESSLGSAAQVVARSRLFGGLTADMDRLTIRESAGEPYDLVLRRWTSTEEWTNGLVAREVVALGALEGHDLPVPRVLAADEDGGAAGVRSVLTTALPGEPDLGPPALDHWLRQLASALVRIHEVPATTSYQSPSGINQDANRTWLGDPGLVKDALAVAHSHVPGAQEVLVHGDYQHFNVLWQNGNLSGVVAWPSAGRGSRGLDVGHCRLNLAVLFSADAADRFLVEYEARSGYRVDPAADLRALLGYSEEWPEFIPIQVHGRAPVDPAGMAGRVAETIRRAVVRAG